MLGNYFLRFDGGESFTKDGFTVNEIIAESLPVSLLVGGAGLILALGLGVPLGVVAAARRNRGRIIWLVRSRWLAFVFRPLSSHRFRSPSSP